MLYVCECVVCWTISAIIQGGVYFREFVLFTSAQYGGFLFGLVVVVFGVAVLTYRRDSHGSVAFDEEDGKGTGASYKTSDDSLLLSEEEYEANLDEEEELERLGSDTSHLLP